MIHEYIYFLNGVISEVNHARFFARILYGFYRIGGVSKQISEKKPNESIDDFLKKSVRGFLAKYSDIFPKECFKEDFLEEFLRIFL